MAWEGRGHPGGRYYTRTRRINGRFVREYIGAGDKGMAAYLEDEARRAEKAAARQARRDAEQEIDALNPADLEDESDSVLSAVMASQGVFRHRREWR